MGGEALFTSINTWAVACMVLGMALVAVEIFTPGFGVPGALGLIFLALCIILQAKTLIEALIIAGVMIILIAVLFFIAVRSVATGRLSRSRIILNQRASRQEGYSAVEDVQDMVGKQGVCITPLRPAGTVEIDGRRLDVVSDLEFINAGEAIVVSAVEGRRIVVRRVGEES